MDNFTYQNPTKLIFGKGQLSELKNESSQFGNKILLVYGGGSIKKNGLYDKVISLLKEQDKTVFELSGVEPKSSCYNSEKRSRDLQKRRNRIDFSSWWRKCY